MHVTVHFYVIVMIKVEPGGSAGSSCEKKLRDCQFSILAIIHPSIHLQRGRGGHNYVIMNQNALNYHLYSLVFLTSLTRQWNMLLRKSWKMIPDQLTRSGKVGGKGAFITGEACLSKRLLD